MSQYEHNLYQTIPVPDKPNHYYMAFGGCIDTAPVIEGEMEARRKTAEQNLMCLNWIMEQELKKYKTYGGEMRHMNSYIPLNLVEPEGCGA